MAARRKEELLRTTGIEKLRQSVVVQSQLEQIDNGVEAKAAFGGMDMAFVNPSGGLMGLSLFGDREVVGLVVEPDQKELELRLRRMGKKDDMDDLLAQGARVVGLTSADLAKWLLYYGEAAGYLPILGARTWEQSGLRKYKREEVNQISAAVRQLVSAPENNAHLHTVGAMKLAPVGGDEKGVYVFEDKGNKEVSVVLRNVRTPEMEGHLLREVINTHEVMGVVLPRHGEDKIGLYIRAYQLGQKYSEVLGREVVFAAATAGQIKIWEGWGMAPEMMAQNLVSESEILDLLIFGESNLLPGLLARADSIGDGQWALLDRKLMPGVITFVGRMSRDGRDIRQLPPVQVFDHRARDKGEFKTIPLNGAVAIMRVPEDMTFEEMKRIAKPIEDRYGHLMNIVGRGEKPKLIFLTPSLMEHWQNGGFWATAEQVKWMDNTRRREYGFTHAQGAKDDGVGSGVFYTAWYNGGAIGGGWRGVLDRRINEPDVLQIEDSGSQFDDVKRADYVRYQDRLISMMSGKTYPLWANLTEPEAIAHSTKIIAQLMESPGANKSPLCMFCATELVANFSEDEIRSILGDSTTEIVMGIGRDNQGRFGDTQMKVVHRMSHIHVDHTSGSQNIRSDIPLLLSLGSLIMAEARDDLNTVSSEILTHPKWYEGKPGKATPRKDRNVIVMRDGQMFETDGVKTEMFYVEHSAFGAMADLTTYRDGTRVADSCDVRRWGRSVSAGSKTERTLTKWANEPPDWLIMEATGIRKGADLRVENWRQRLKREAPVTDEDITQGVFRVLNDPENAGKTIVVYSSPYDIERNVAIMEAVKMSGRESVLGVRHAMIASRYSTEQQLLGPDARLHDGFDLEVPPYGLFLTEGSKKRSAVTALKSGLVGRGTEIYDRNNVLKNPRGRVLLFNPFGNEISSLENLPLKNQFEVIWSSSIMYSQADMLNFLKNKASIFTRYTNRLYAEPNFWPGRISFSLVSPEGGHFHRSGHNNLLEFLWYLSFFQGKELSIIIHHCEWPGKAKEIIKEAFPKEKWRIIDSLPHVNLDELPSKEKHWMGPMLRLSK